MVRQISLDAWQIQHLTALLRRGSEAAKQTGAPIILYRQTLEEEEGSYEEIVCSLTEGHVIEQRVISGGVIPPSFGEQAVFSIDEYPARLMKASRDRFLQTVSFLEEHLE